MAEHRRGAKILTRVGLPFIVQTTVGAPQPRELDAIAAFAHDELGAKVWNLYFLVPSGRGAFVTDLEPAEYDQVLARSAGSSGSGRPDAGQRQVRAALRLACGTPASLTARDSAGAASAGSSDRASPAAPAAARRAPTTWGSDPTAT